MSAAMTSYKERARESTATGMDAVDLTEIRRATLSNISGEILQISDLIESSVVDLSDEFMKLVKYSERQVEDMTKACDLLQVGALVKEDSTKEAVHEMLMESAQTSAYFHENVNKMIYTIQFQDRTRQLMRAISVAIEILGDLSEQIEDNQHSEKTKTNFTLSEDNKVILNRLIEAASHQELDQNYILRMFLGNGDANDDGGADGSGDDTDIEFF